MPHPTCNLVAGHVAYGNDTRGMTYSEAARALLAYRQAGAHSARSFLDSAASSG
jgi:hypothetical protein